MAKRALGPATLAIVRAVRATCDPERPWLVACSGGRDSLALTAAAGLAGADRVTALVVDHGLQPGSAGVAGRAHAQLTARGIAVEVVPVDVGTRGGPEAAAREARYAVLLGRASELGADLVLGHTRDDQAETVLLGLARGAGPRALAGMPVRTVREDVGPESRGVALVRPLIDLRRETCAEACRELGLDWWDDPHNEDDRFARSRVRKHVLPVLERELGAGVVDALARSARMLRDDADLLDALAVDERTTLAPQPGTGNAAAGEDAAGDPLPAVALAARPAAIRTRVLRDWLRDRGATDLAEVHVTAVDRLVTAWHGQGPVDVPGLRVVRRDGLLHAVADG